MKTLAGLSFHVYQMDKHPKAGETAQQLIVLAALTEDPGLVFKIHTRQPVIPTLGNPALSSGLFPRMQVKCPLTHMHT